MECRVLFWQLICRLTRIKSTACKLFWRAGLGGLMGHKNDRLGQGTGYLLFPKMSLRVMFFLLEFSFALQFFYWKMMKFWIFWRSVETFRCNRRHTLEWYRMNMHVSLCKTSIKFKPTRNHKGSFVKQWSRKRPVSIVLRLFKPWCTILSL